MEGFAFFHLILFLVSRLKLHPFTLRNDLLVISDFKRTQLIGWTSVFLNILHLPLVISRIKEAGKIEGTIHSYLILLVAGGITLKMTILLYHSELIQVANNIVLLNQKIAKNNFKKCLVGNFFSLKM